MQVTFRNITRSPALVARLCAALTALALALVSTASDIDHMQRSIIQRFGPDAGHAFNDWRGLLAQSATLPEADKLRRVNDFFNRRISFEDDIVVWGQVDYWATPLEMLGKGAGDCEDFVIGKYFSLIELGIPANQMRLTYVRARIGGPQSNITQAHMVLSYYSTPDAEPLVLDNLIGDIRPASRRPDLTPVFSFNSDGVYLAGASTPSTPVDRLSRWKDLLLKMKAEGYEP